MLYVCIDYRRLIDSKWYVRGMTIRHVSNTPSVSKLLAKSTEKTTNERGLGHLRPNNNIIHSIISI